MARIVFDLDGTLVDSAPDICAAANAALGNMAAPLSLEETRDFVGSGAPIFVERMVDARGIDPTAMPDLLVRFLEVYEGAVDLTHPYPGVMEVLTELRAAGHRLGICTNKPLAPTRRVLAHLKMAEYFEVVFGGDSLAVKKPAPEPLQAALAALGDGPQVYVGDSEVDAEAAYRAGVPFVLFTEGYAHVPVADMSHAGSFADWRLAAAAIQKVLVDWSG